MYTKAISYSGLSLYRKCPAAWSDVYINGNRGKSGAAAERGTMLHKKLENLFTKDETIVTDTTLKPWGPYMEQLKVHRPRVEVELAATEDWCGTEFSSEDANARGAVDLLYQLPYGIHIKDWKSGRVYPSHEEQGKFYAALALAVMDNQGAYEIEMVYLDQPGMIQKWSYDYEEVSDIQDALGEEIRALRLVEEYAPTPSNENCKWCPLSWRNGGKCHASP